MSCNSSGIYAFGNSWWWIIILILIFGLGNNGSCGCGWGRDPRWSYWTGSGGWTGLLRTRIWNTVSIRPAAIPPGPLLLPGKGSSPSPEATAWGCAVRR